MYCHNASFNHIRIQNCLFVVGLIAHIPGSNVVLEPLSFSGFYRDHDEWASYQPLSQLTYDILVWSNLFYTLVSMVTVWEGKARPHSSYPGSWPNCWRSSSCSSTPSLTPTVSCCRTYRKSLYVHSHPLCLCSHVVAPNITKATLMVLNIRPKEIICVFPATWLPFKMTASLQYFGGFWQSFF